MTSVKEDITLGRLTQSMQSKDAQNKLQQITKALTNWLDLSDSRVKGLTEAFDVWLSSDEMDSQDCAVRDNLARTIFVMSSRLLLQEKNATNTPIISDLVSLLNRVRESAANKPELTSLMDKLLAVAKTPWSHPVLKGVLIGQPLPLYEVLSYLCGEPLPLLWVRIELLMQGPHPEYALNLLHWLLLMPQLQNAIHLHVLQLKLLYAHNQKEFDKQCIKLSCCRSLQILKSVVDSQEVSAFSVCLARTFVLQVWFQLRDCCCVKDLVYLWLLLEQEASQSSGSAIDDALNTVIKLSHRASQLLVLVQAANRLKLELKEEMHARMLDKALQMAREALQQAASTDSTAEAEAATKMLLDLCTLAQASYKEKGIPRVYKAALVASFSLHPDQETMGVLQEAYISLGCHSPPGLRTDFSSKKCGRMLATQSEDEPGQGLSTEESPPDQRANGEHIKELVQTLSSVTNPLLDPSLPWMSLKWRCLAQLKASRHRAAKSSSSTPSLEHLPSPAKAPETPAVGSLKKSGTLTKSSKTVRWRDQCEVLTGSGASSSLESTCELQEWTEIEGERTKRKVLVEKIDQDQQENHMEKISPDTNGLNSGETETSFSRAAGVVGDSGAQDEEEEDDDYSFNVSGITPSDELSSSDSFNSSSSSNSSSNSSLVTGSANSDNDLYEVVFESFESSRDESVETNEGCSDTELNASLPKDSVEDKTVEKAAFVCDSVTEIYMGLPEKAAAQSSEKVVRDAKESETETRVGKETGETEVTGSRQTNDTASRDKSALMSSAEQLTEAPATAVTETSSEKLGNEATASGNEHDQMTVVDPETPAEKATKATETVTETPKDNQDCVTETVVTETATRNPPNGPELTTDEKSIKSVVEGPANATEAEAIDSGLDKRLTETTGYSSSEMPTEKESETAPGEPPVAIVSELERKLMNHSLLALAETQTEKTSAQNQFMGSESVAPKFSSKAETKAERTSNGVDTVAEKPPDVAKTVAEKPPDMAKTAAEKSPDVAAKTAAEKQPDVDETVVENPTDASEAETKAETTSNRVDTVDEKPPDVAETAAEKPPDVAETATEKPPDVVKPTAEKPPNGTETTAEEPLDRAEKPPDGAETVDEKPFDGAKRAAEKTLDGAETAPNSAETTDVEPYKLAETTAEEPPKEAETTAEEPTYGADITAEKSSDGVETTAKKPSAEAECTAGKSQDEAGTGVEKPLDEADITAEKPPDEAELPAGKPLDETERAAEKPPNKAETSAEKPPDETATLAEKPPDETETLAEKPPDEAETSAEKPPDETESAAEKPPDKAETSAEKPPDETETAAEKPPDMAETAAEKPPDGTETAAEKPPDMAETTAEKPPDESDTAAEKPPAGTEKAAEKPPDETEPLAEKPPIRAEIVPKKIFEEEETLSLKQANGTEPALTGTAVVIAPRLQNTVTVVADALASTETALGKQNSVAETIDKPRNRTEMADEKLPDETETPGQESGSDKARVETETALPLEHSPADNNLGVDKPELENQKDVSDNVDVRLDITDICDNPTCSASEALKGQLKETTITGKDHLASQTEESSVLMKQTFATGSLGVETPAKMTETNKTETSNEKRINNVGTLQTGLQRGLTPKSYNRAEKSGISALALSCEEGRPEGTGHKEAAVSFHCCDSEILADVVGAQRGSVETADSSDLELAKTGSNPVESPVSESVILAKGDVSSVSVSSDLMKVDQQKADLNSEVGQLFANGSATSGCVQTKTPTIPANKEVERASRKSDSPDSLGSLMVENLLFDPLLANLPYVPEFSEQNSIDFQDTQVTVQLLDEVLNALTAAARNPPCGEGCLATKPQLLPETTSHPTEGLKAECVPYKDIATAQAVENPQPGEQQEYIVEDICEVVDVETEASSQDVIGGRETPESEESQELSEEDEEEEPEDLGYDAVEHAEDTTEEEPAEENEDEESVSDSDSDEEPDSGSDEDVLPLCKNAKKGFLCTKCKQVFNSWKEHTDHAETCPRVSDSESSEFLAENLLDHEESDKEDSPVVKLGLPKSVSPLKESLRKKRIVKMPDNKFGCSLCDYTASRCKQLQEHFHAQHSEARQSIALLGAVDQAWESITPVKKMPKRHPWSTSRGRVQLRHWRNKVTMGIPYGLIGNCCVCKKTLQWGSVRRHLRQLHGEDLTDQSDSMLKFQAAFVESSCETEASLKKIVADLISRRAAAAAAKKAQKHNAEKTAAEQQPLHEQDNQVVTAEIKNLTPSTKHDTPEIKAVTPEVSKTPKTTGVAPKKNKETQKTKKETPKSEKETPKTKNDSSKSHNETPKNKNESQKTKYDSPKTKNESSKTNIESLKSKNETPKTNKNKSEKNNNETPRTRSAAQKTKNDSPKTKSESSKTNTESSESKNETQKNKKESPKTENESPKTPKTKNTESKSTKNDNETPRTRSAAQKTKNDSPKTKSESSKPNTESSESKNETQKNKKESSMTENESTKTKDDSPDAENETPKTNNESPNTENESLNIENESSNTENESSKTNNETPKTDIESPKFEKETPKSKKETPVSITGVGRDVAARKASRHPCPIEDCPKIHLQKGIDQCLICAAVFLGGKNSVRRHLMKVHKIDISQFCSYNTPHKAFTPGKDGTSKEKILGEEILNSNHTEAHSATVGTEVGKKPTKKNSKKGSSFSAMKKTPVAKKLKSSESSADELSKWSTKGEQGQRPATVDIQGDLSNTNNNNRERQGRVKFFSKAMKASCRLEHSLQNKDGSEPEDDDTEQTLLESSLMSSENLPSDISGVECMNSTIDGSALDLDQTLVLVSPPGRSARELPGNAQDGAVHTPQAASRPTSQTCDCSKGHQRFDLQGSSQGQRHGTRVQRVVKVTATMSSLHRHIVQPAVSNAYVRQATRGSRCHFRMSTAGNNSLTPASKTSSLAGNVSQKRTDDFCPSLYWCGACCRSVHRSQLTLHLHTHRYTSDIQPKDLTFCIYCREIFPSEMRLRQHQARQHPHHRGQTELLFTPLCRPASASDAQPFTGTEPESNSNPSFLSAHIDEMPKLQSSVAELASALSAAFEQTFEENEELAQSVTGPAFSSPSRDHQTEGWKVKFVSPPTHDPPKSRKKSASRASKAAKKHSNAEQENEVKEMPSAIANSPSVCSSGYFGSDATPSPQHISTPEYLTGVSGMASNPPGTSSNPPRTSSNFSGTSSHPPQTSSNFSGAPSNNTETLSNPLGTSSNPLGTSFNPPRTSSNPLRTSSNPLRTSSDPPRTPSDPPRTSSNSSETSSNFPCSLSYSPGTSYISSTPTTSSYPPGISSYPRRPTFYSPGILPCYRSHPSLKAHHQPCCQIVGRIQEEADSSQAENKKAEQSKGSSGFRIIVPEKHSADTVPKKVILNVKLVPREPIPQTKDDTRKRVYVGGTNDQPLVVQGKSSNAEESEIQTPKKKPKVLVLSVKTSTSQTPSTSSETDGGCVPTKLFTPSTRPSLSAVREQSDADAGSASKSDNAGNTELNWRQNVTVIRVPAPKARPDMKLIRVRQPLSSLACQKRKLPLCTGSKTKRAKLGLNREIPDDDNSVGITSGTELEDCHSSAKIRSKKSKMPSASTKTGRVIIKPRRALANKASCSTPGQLKQHFRKEKMDPASDEDEEVCDANRSELFNHFNSPDSEVEEVSLLDKFLDSVGDGNETAKSFCSPKSEVEKVALLDQSLKEKLQQVRLRRQRQTKDNFVTIDAKDNLAWQQDSQDDSDGCSERNTVDKLLQAGTESPVLGSELSWLDDRGSTRTGISSESVQWCPVQENETVRISPEKKKLCDSPEMKSPNREEAVGGFLSEAEIGKDVSSSSKKIFIAVPRVMSEQWHAASKQTFAEVDVEAEEQASVSPHKIHPTRPELINNNPSVVVKKLSASTSRTTYKLGKFKQRKTAQCSVPDCSSRNDGCEVTTTCSVMIEKRRKTRLKSQLADKWSPRRKREILETNSPSQKLQDTSGETDVSRSLCRKTPKVARKQTRGKAVNVSTKSNKSVKSVERQFFKKSVGVCRTKVSQETRTSENSRTQSKKLDISKRVRSKGNSTSAKPQKSRVLKK